MVKALVSTTHAHPQGGSGDETGKDDAGGDDPGDRGDTVIPFIPDHSFIDDNGLMFLRMEILLEAAAKRKGLPGETYYEQRIKKEWEELDRALEEVEAAIASIAGWATAKYVMAHVRDPRSMELPPSTRQLVGCKGFLSVVAIHLFWLHTTQSLHDAHAHVTIAGRPSQGEARRRWRQVCGHERCCQGTLTRFESCPQTPTSEIRAGGRPRSSSTSNLNAGFLQAPSTFAGAEDQETSG